MILDDIELPQNIIPYFIVDSKYTMLLVLSAKWWILQSRYLSTPIPRNVIIVTSLILLPLYKT